MKKVLVYISAATILLVLLYVVVDTSRVFIAYTNSEESSEKSEWSVLQSIEHQNRDKPLKKSITVQEIKDGEDVYLVLGVALIGGGSTWMILNPKSEPLIKQLPKITDYELSKEDIETVRKIKNVNSVVMSELERHQK